MANNLSVQLKYKLRDEGSWREKDISLAEYFDLEEDKKSAMDSVPMYMHAVEYLDKSSADIEFTIVTIADGNTSKLVEIRETFWNEGKNRIVERIDLIKNELVYNEVIVQVEYSSSEFETIRFEREGRINKLTYHSIDD
jgi:hypothetical protein